MLLLNMSFMFAFERAGSEDEFRHDFMISDICFLYDRVEKRNE